MDNELVSNAASTVTAHQPMAALADTGEEAEIASIEQDFVQFDEDFGTTVMAPETATPETSLLDQATEGTPFSVPQAETGGTLTLLDIADGNFGADEEGWISSAGRWLSSAGKSIVNAIKNRAQKIIKKMVALARRLGKYRACISKIVSAIKAFKAKKYGSAIVKGFAAFRCIKSARA